MPARPLAVGSRHGAGGIAFLLLGAVLSACTSPGAIVDPKAACDALAAPIAAASIGLPTRGATIDSALLVEASAEAPTHPLPFVPPPPEAVIAPAMPQHCRVVGRIASVDATAPPIRFQVNLPSDWNRRSLQFGGGGFNLRHARRRPCRHWRAGRPRHARGAGRLGRAQRGAGRSGAGVAAGRAAARADRLAADVPLPGLSALQGVRRCGAGGELRVRALALRLPDFGASPARAPRHRCDEPAGRKRPDDHGS